MIAHARAVGMPVVFVQNNGGPDDPDVHGTPGWEIDPRLAPQPGEEIVQKYASNAFADTELAQRLAARGVDALIICGLQSEYCIQATTRSAAALGYGVTLASDGHSTYDGAMPAPAQIAAINASLGSVAELATVSALTTP